MPLGANAFTRHCLAVLLACLVAPGCVPRNSRAPLATEPAPTPAPAPTDDDKARVFLARARENVWRTVPVDDPQSPVGLATRGLSFAPKASAATVVDLLITRADGLMRLEQYDAAGTDLDAASVWAERDRARSVEPLAKTELAWARLALARGDWTAAVRHGQRARAFAGRLELRGALLACEAIVLLAGLPEQAPEGALENAVLPGYLEVYRILESYGYPRELWRIAFSTLRKLPSKSDEEVKQLMGPAPIWSFDREYFWDDQGFAPDAATARVERGNLADGVSNANRVVARMRAGFRRCYQRALNEDPTIEGVIALTLHVGSKGRVTRVSGRMLELRQSVGTCVMARASQATFDPPAGGSALINVPITFVKK